MRTRRNSRFFVIALAAVALVGGSAFTASNTGIDGHIAGQGQAAVSGVDISGFDYGLTDDKSEITSATFYHNDDTLASTPESYTAEVAIYPDGTTSPTWANCTISDDTASPYYISCDSSSESGTSLFNVLMGNADNLGLSVMENTN